MMYVNEAGIRSYQIVVPMYWYPTIWPSFSTFDELLGISYVSLRFHRICPDVGYKSEWLGNAMR